MPKPILRPLTALTGLIAVLISIAITSAPSASADDAPTPSHPGSMSVVANCPGINPIHTSMTRTGKVLMVAGSGYNKQNHDLHVNQAWIYDPAEPSACPVEIPLPVEDLFCAGMSHLPDGRILFYGGTGQYAEAGSYPGSPGYYTGIRAAFAFDDTTNSFERMPMMHASRWYGQGTADANGDVVVVGGLDENAADTHVIERFNADSETWTQLPTPSSLWTYPMYAGMALLPDGRMAYSGTYFYSRNGLSPKVWNPSAGTAYNINGLVYPDCRDQGSTVVLYPTVYVIGGGCRTGATGTVGAMEMRASSPTFTTGPYLGYAAQHICATALPDRSIYVAGGTDHNTNPRYEARRLGNTSSSWQTLARPTVARGYHSTCLPLLDGRVLMMGSNWSDGRVETRLEVYNPWYTQPGLVRPRIATLSCAEVPLGGSIDMTYEVATIKGATLTSLPSSTHSAPEARTIAVGITPHGFGQTTVTMPSSGNLTPPGHYMLSLLDWRGAPTISRIIQITPSGDGCCC